MRLRTQLLLLTLGPLVAVGVVAVGLMWEPIDRLLLAGVANEAREQLETQGQALEADVVSLQARLDAYASMPAIREGTPETIARTLIPRRADVPGIDVLNFVTASGVVHQPNGTLLNVRNRPYFPAVRRGEPYVSRALISVDGGMPEVMVLRPVRNPAGAVTGAVGASLRLTDMLDRIRGIRLTHPGFVLLVDGDGRTLSGATLPGVAATSALYGDSVPDKSPPAWRAMLDTMRRERNGTTTLVIDNERYLVSFRHLPTLDWQMAVGFEETALFAPRNRIALRAFVVFVLIALVGVAAAITVQKRVATPLAALADAQVQVSRGDLSVRAPVPAQAELAQLATSFNTMANDLRAHERDRQAELLHRAEAAAVLAEHEAMLRAVFDASPMAIAVFREADGRYVRANAAFAQLCGMTPEDVIGRSVEDVGLVQDAAHRLHVRARRERDGTVHAERVRRVDAEGRAKDLLFSAVPFVVDGERLVLTASVDISETVRLEAQLRQSQKLDVVGRLAGGVAHDFNNMLTGIIGAADLIGSELDASATLQEEVSVIRESAARAATLTRQLLTFSRVQPVTTQVMDAHEPVRAAIALARRTFNRSVVLDEALDAESSRVRGDAALLQTVVMNLLVNARDAMADGGSIRVRSRNRVATDTDIEGPVWVLEVHDTGHGMTPDVAERIFEPFFTTKAPGQGTGLGLSVAFGIVREHGGDIQVSSAVDVGATFTLTLPLETTVANATIATAPAASFTKGRTHVLVVDDEALVRATTARALRLAGHTVHVAADGMAAVAIVDGGIHIDVAVLDLVMPGMDGVETLRALRERLPTLPVVIASGYGADGAFQALAATPGVQFLPKPFGMAELTAAVARAAESMVDQPT